jgi:hypothetical protein
VKENLKEGNLRKWFQDGGWNRYNTKGEKVGKCARDDKDGDGKADGPKPKCLPASRAASLGKKKIAAAVKRKRREDPNPDRTGAAKNVKTVSKKNEEFDMEIQESDKKGKGSGQKDACYHKVKRTAKVWPSAYASGRLVQCRKKGAANYGNSKNEEFMALPEFSDIQINSMRAAGIEVEVLDEKCWKGYEKKGMKTMFGKRYPNCVKKEEVEQVKEGDGDPCWDTHKQVGMKKKGGRMVPNCVPKNEEVQMTERERVLEGLMGDRAKKAVDHQRKGTHGDDHEMKKDMDSAQKSVDRMNTRMGADAAAKRVERDVKRRFPKNEEVELEDANGKKFAEVIDVVTNEDLGITMSEAARIPQQYGNIYLVGFNWKSRYMMMRLFFPEVKKPSRKEVQEALDKIYPGCVVQRFDIVPYKPGEPMLNMGVKEEAEQLDEKSAAWQRKEGKSKTGGLNEKGRKSYERENPGSDLKAPQPEGGPRKRSFCARMGGVKGPMKKPDGSPTRKALALRKWKC